MQKISVLAGLALAVASPLLADEARTLRLADGVNMAYVERGGTGDPAMVFVHCANCHKEDLAETLDAFAATHLVMAMDLAGHGSSRANRERFRSIRSADVAALVEHLKPPRAQP